MVKQLALGADINACVFEAQSSDEKSYFVKVKNGHPDEMNLMIFELLQSVGIQDIIFPLKTTEGNLTHKHDDNNLIVYPFVDGQDGFHRSLSHQQWIRLGKTLSKIHSVEVPGSIQDVIRREDFSPKWRNVVKSLYAQIEKMEITDEIGLKFSQLIVENKETIEQMINYAEKLGVGLQNQSLKYVLCHSDIHAGNILLSENDTFHIVDWDDPIMAPKERDLMFIGGGVGNVWNQQNEEELFYKGYENESIDETILAYYRFERIVEDIAEYGQELLFNDGVNKDREQMYRDVLDQFEPQGVIDIAFRTYKKLVQ